MTDARRQALLDLVRRRFEPLPRTAGAPRVGLEVEVIPRRAHGGRVAPAQADADGSGTLGVLRTLAAREAWREEATPYGLPQFSLPGGAIVSYEPGGQIEYSSAPQATLGALDAELRRHFALLGEAMAGQGIELLARGLDPVNAADADAPMVLTGERYARQRAHYDRRGPHGRTMMLRTAGIHLNIDPADDADAGWEVANALTPALIAIFANAPQRPGTSERLPPHRSHRAAAWRALDPTRTGVGGTVESYLDFALGAESFLLGPVGAPSRPFAAWLADGASDIEFAAHLSTLFPEVRPRRYLEIRSVDTLPARWCIVPAAFAYAALHHAPTRARLRHELPPPSVARLETAGRLGLADAALGDEVRWLVPLLLDALGALATDAASRGVVSRTQEFVNRFAGRGQDPGHAVASRADD